MVRWSERQYSSCWDNAVTEKHCGSTMVKWWYPMVIPWYKDLYMLINIWWRETVQMERWYFIFVSFSPTFWDVWGCFVPIFTSAASVFSVSHNSDQWFVHRATANFTFIQHLTIALLFLIPTKIPQTHFNKSRCWWGFRENCHWEETLVALCKYYCTTVKHIYTVLLGLGDIVKKRMSAFWYF